MYFIFAILSLLINILPNVSEGQCQQEVLHYMNQQRSSYPQFQDRMVYSIICLNDCVTINGHVNVFDFKESGSVMLDGETGLLSGHWVTISGRGDMRNRFELDSVISPTDFLLRVAGGDTLWPSYWAFEYGPPWRGQRFCDCE